MAEENSYNLKLVNASVPQFDGFFFITQVEVDLFLNNLGNSVTLDVVFFPNNENASGPSRYSFTGIPMSGILNEKATKGRFLFSDGTYVYFNASLLG